MGVIIIILQMRKLSFRGAKWRSRSICYQLGELEETQASSKVQSFSELSQDVCLSVRSNDTLCPEYKVWKFIELAVETELLVLFLSLTTWVFYYLCAALGSSTEICKAVWCRGKIEMLWGLTELDLLVTVWLLTSCLTSRSLHFLWSRENGL